MSRAAELQEQAWGLQGERQYDAAYALTLQALQLVELEEGPESLDAANLLNELAEIERDRQRFSRAVEHATRAEDIEASWSSDSDGAAALPIRMKTESLLGELRRLLGDYALAEAHLKQALHLATLSGDHGEAAARASNDLGVLYKFWGRFDGALALYEAALCSITARVPGDSLELATLKHNIGGALHGKGDFAAAEQPAREAWDIARRLLGDDEPEVLLHATAYAAVLTDLGRFRESEAICRRAHVVFEASFGAEHHEVAANLHNLAAVLAEQGQASEAVELYRRALEIRRRVQGDHHADVGLTLNNLGRLLLDLGQRDEALSVLLEASTTLTAALTSGHPHLGRVRANLQRALAAP